MLAKLVDQVTKAIRHYERHGIHPTERETIDKLVLPFIEHALGADFRDPAAVTAEFDADIGRSKGEKVDYAINRHGEPVILIECKALGTPLEDKAVQLQRYIGALPKVSLGILTDGRHYRFYADLDEPNILDKEPFLHVDVLDMTLEAEERLELFHLDCLDVVEIKTAGRRWKTVVALVRALESEWNEPSKEYVAHFAKPLHRGLFTDSIRRQYIGYLKEAHSLFLDNRTRSDDDMGSKPKGRITGDNTSQKPNGTPQGDGYRLSEVEPSQLTPQLLQFADGSTKVVDSWRGYFEAIVLKLDSEGHFQVGNIPKDLRQFIYVPDPNFPLKRSIQLSHGLETNIYLNSNDCIKRAKRVLRACGYDPADIYVK